MRRRRGETEWEAGKVREKRGKWEREEGKGGEREREKGEKPQENYWPDEVLTSGNAIDR